MAIINCSTDTPGRVATSDAGQRIAGFHRVTATVVAKREALPGQPLWATRRGWTTGRSGCRSGADNGAIGGRAGCAGSMVCAAAAPGGSSRNTYSRTRRPVLGIHFEQDVQIRIVD